MTEKQAIRQFEQETAAMIIDIQLERAVRQWLESLPEEPVANNYRIT